MIELIRRLLDIALHLDRHLAELTAQYGTWTYAILILVVFCETGLVVTPILPGDSLLFAAGAISALGSLDPVLLNILIFAAVLAGDNVNYWIGRAIGPRAFQMNSRFFKRKHLEYTQGYFARHGGMTVVLARFVPIVRTFTPFVAGIGAMTYPQVSRVQYRRRSAVGHRVHLGGVLLRQPSGGSPELRSGRARDHSPVRGSDDRDRFPGAGASQMRCVDAI